MASRQIVILCVHAYACLQEALTSALVLLAVLPRPDSAGGSPACFSSSAACRSNRSATWRVARFGARQIRPGSLAEPGMAHSWTGCMSACNRTPFSAKWMILTACHTVSLHVQGMRSGGRCSCSTC